LIKIDEQEVAAVAKTAHRFPWELLTIVLCVCIAFLFGAYAGLNTFIRTDLMDANSRAATAIEGNTKAMNEFIFYQKYRSVMPDYNNGDTPNHNNQKSKK
jgi:hypothetical protein